MPESEVRPPDFAAWQHDTLVQFATEALDKLQKQKAEIEQLRLDLRAALDAYRKEITRARKAD
ncbi:MAG: hypothetical protein ACO3VO_08490 [Ilumatobacteraceae bacterium]